MTKNEKKARVTELFPIIKQKCIDYINDSNEIELVEIVENWFPYDKESLEFVKLIGELSWDELT